MNTSASIAMPWAPERERAEHVALMYGQTSYLATPAIALVSVVALWSFTEPARLLAWFAAICAIVVSRAALVRRYRARERAVHEASRWGWLYAASSTLSGLAWGALSLVAFDPAQPATVLFAGWIMAGMVTAAVPLLSNFPPAYHGYAACATLPYAWRCAQTGETIYLGFAAITLVFLAVNVGFARAMFRSTAASIRLRFENLALLEELRVAKEQAETASAAKTRFLAAASHDLRQPTHALGLFVSAVDRIVERDAALRAGASGATLAATVARMKATLKGLGTLLTSLLDASRLDAGAVAVRRGTVRLQDCLDALANEFADLARERGLALHPLPTALHADSDPVLLRRILANFVANAIKYTERGRVVVACRRRGREIEIQVRDSGPGIDPRFHQDIFREFTQLGDAAQRREQGLGLGLAICRRMADLLGHAIGLRSLPGRGAVFFVRVPRVQPAPPLQVEVPRAHHLADRGTTVLVIDDDVAAREAVTTLLELQGHHVLAAADVDAALDHLRDAGVGARIGCVVADYRLGNGTTGLHAIAAVRAALAREVPALIVTGDTSPDRMREVQASGIALLHKPLDAETLLQHTRAAAPRALPA